MNGKKDELIKYNKNTIARTHNEHTITILWQPENKISQGRVSGRSFLL